MGGQESGGGAEGPTHSAFTLEVLLVDSLMGWMWRERERGVKGDHEFVPESEEPAWARPWCRVRGISS